MSKKMRMGLFSLLGFVLVLSAVTVQAAPTGAVAAKIAFEIKGKVIPVNTAQVTILEKGIDLETIDFLAKKKAEKSKNKQRTYHLYRYIYLVKAVEDSRRAGVRQVRYGIVTKRADYAGQVLVRYLPPGDYFIAAYRKLGEKCVVWHVPFSVTAGRVTQIDLDNTNAFEVYYPSLYPN